MGRRNSRRRGRRVSVGELSFFSFQDIITSVTGILLLLTLIMATSMTEATPKPQAAVSSRPAVVDDPAAVTEAVRRLASDETDAHTDIERAKLLRDGRAVLKVVTDAVGPQADGAAVDRVLATLPALAIESAPQIESARARLRELDAAIAAVRSQTEQADRAAVAAATDEAKKTRGLTFLVGPQKAKPLIVELAATRTRVGDLTPDGRARLLAEAAVGDDDDAITQALAKLGHPDVAAVLLVHPDAAGRFHRVLDAIKARGIRAGWDVAPDKPVFDGDGGANAPTP